MTFEQQLKKVSAFLTPENLAQQKIALLVVDVQRKFCDPKRGSYPRGNQETKEISERIAALVPEFRKAGIPVYAIYFGGADKKPEDVDFYLFKPEADDTVVRKSTNSAFKTGPLKSLLAQDGRTLLLTCGFNLNACVHATAADARKSGYAVCLLDDLCGNDNNHAFDEEDPQAFIDDLVERGVSVEQSASTLKKIAAVKGPMP